MSLIMRAFSGSCTPALTRFRIITIAVDTALQAFLIRVDPVLRTWNLMQEERAQIIPAAEAEDARAARARHTLRLLMRCPIADVVFHVCCFAF